MKMEVVDINDWENLIMYLIVVTHCLRIGI